MVRTKHSNHEGSSHHGGGSRRVHEGEKDGDGARPSGCGRIQKENNEALEQYNVDTAARVADYLLMLRSNYILHAQVIVGPFDVSQVNFSCLRHYVNNDMNFYAMSPSGAE
ncbi:hypothetical protein GOBAR_DD16897 [Gossypium barbadense]|nr:hypothetical protein GOBAR_DD16897 [Gossypium barbadense]